MIEGRPRLKTANKVVSRLLEAEMGLGSGFRSLTHRLPNNGMMMPTHLHEKLYYFSHPRPVAFVGSFNPSGNQPEDPNVIRESGIKTMGTTGSLKSVIQKSWTSSPPMHAGSTKTNTARLNVLHPNSIIPSVQRTCRCISFRVG